MRSWPLAVALLLAGCLSSPPAPTQPSGPGAAPPFAAATAIADPCPALRQVECFEASVAADPAGRVYAANTSCTGIARSTDGGATFSPLPPPPPTAEMVPPADLGDCTLQVDPEGHLWFSALAREAGANPLTGLQVARSDDGGQTWPVDRFFAAAVPPLHLPEYATDLPVTTNADRQWLAFGAAGSVWFTYWDWQAGHTFVARSPDAGATWSGMEPMPGYLAGRPLVTHDGAFHSPSQDFGDPYTILDTVADGRSGDGMDFQQVSAFKGSRGHTWCAYPSIAEAPDGPLFMVWQDESQRVLVSVSKDGGAKWSAPARWNEPGATLTPGQRSDRDGSCAAIAAVGGDLIVMWYEQRDGKQAVLLARSPLADAEAGPVARTAVATYDAAHQTTDFADFTALPDGRLVVGFTEPGVGLRVAVAGAPWT